MTNTSPSSHRFDYFEPGEKTALVCLEGPNLQTDVNQQLADLGYKIHTGLFLDDSVLKLRTHSYDLVVVSDHFEGSAEQNHPLLAEVAKLPAAQRRQQVIVIVGDKLRTNDELEAFSRSVDLVIAPGDLANLRPILRRICARLSEFYGPLNEALEAKHRAELASRSLTFVHGR